MTPPPVKLAALELGLPVYQPETLRPSEMAEPLRAAEPDVLVVVAYGAILRRHVLELAPHGAVNVHPSLLPRYRGSSPVRAAILNGDNTTGVSIIKLVQKLDAGPILRQEEVPINPDENADELSNRLAALAAGMLPQTCIDWISGEINPREQDESQATMTREWSRNDAAIDWRRPAIEVGRLVRASQPWPVAWTVQDGEPFRIHQATITNAGALASGAVTRVGKQVIVGCGDGVLELLTVQPAGKQAMPALNWWNGVQSDAVQFDVSISSST
ncbi:methionyl-tRNA formyltransferase [soil metagenome]